MEIDDCQGELCQYKPSTNVTRLHQSILVENPDLNPMGTPLLSHIYGVGTSHQDNP